MSNGQEKVISQQTSTGCSLSKQEGDFKSLNLTTLHLKSASEGKGATLAVRLKSNLRFKKEGHLRRETRGWEESNHPDLLSTSHSDKSHRAAVLDDRLSRCAEPSQMLSANSKVL